MMLAHEGAPTKTLSRFVSCIRLFAGASRSLRTLAFAELGFDLCTLSIDITLGVGHNLKTAKARCQVP